MVETKIDFAPFAARMQAEGLPEIAIRTFEYYYHQLVKGETGLISEGSIESVDSLPDADTLPDTLNDVGHASLESTVVIKLNGGLGTSMGLSKAKSLLPVKEGLTFLDIIAKQALSHETPLVLMNSFNTQSDSLAALEKYPELRQTLPLDFVQHKIPKIKAADFSPAEYEADDNLTWCPPGHGDIYTALVTSGMLETLINNRFKYAFVSNSDNLGAVIDTKILGYFAEHNLPFMMEVADRTPADSKGGHLARRPDGQLILRESAQCPDEDMDTFQDITRHKYFNTNNLWINLEALQTILNEKENILGLPMIRNSKTVNPRDKSSDQVFQLETAMGSAIEVFKGAGAIRVPRSRFAPVKKSQDLLAVRSDCYVLTDDFRIVANPERALDQIVIKLSDHYKLVDQMEARFPYGAPSLIACQTLKIDGDVRFGKDVVVKGEVSLSNDRDGQMTIKDGTVLE